MQAVVAKYLYDPFGDIESKSGSLADANLYRFSSKEAHPVSSLVYYLYRYYAPRLQRWVNRDPIREKGGIDLFRLLFNDPLNDFDAFGLSGGDSIKPIPPENRECCTSDKVSTGEAELNKRFQAAVTALSKAGIKAVPTGAAGASCKRSSSDILSEWLLPTPPCWKCTLEHRTLFPDGKGSDHQAIICTAYPRSGPSKEILFDWWTDDRKGTHSSGGGTRGFRLSWPFFESCEDNPSYTDCRGNQVTVKPHVPTHSFPACTAK